MSNALSQLSLTHPLAGIRVLEMGDGIAPAFCGKLFAGLGAQVVKLEPPAGIALRHRAPFAADTFVSLPFLYGNTGKSSLTIEITTPSGRELLTKLLAHFDIVLDGGNQLAVCGIDTAWLEKQMPQLVVMRITAFGETGPYSQYQGNDLVEAALGGMLNMVGEPDREPLKLGGSQIEYATALQAFTTTLIAFYHREKTGYGQTVSVTGQETAAYMEWKGGVFFQADGTLHRRATSGLFALPCADGYLAFYYRDEDWPRVSELFAHDERLKDSRFATSQGRNEHRRDLYEVFSSLTRNRSKHELYHAGQALGIPLGITATAEDLVNSPQYQARAFLLPIQEPALGNPLQPGLPFLFNGQRPQVTDSAPALGAETSAILQQKLGLTETEIDGLRDRGII